ncbi:MAG: M23 family metallopeptidase [Oscillospiraceae bacterium]|nr:M23 family metallopeptidase [Oscillospiraceae bacterium]
MNSLRKALNAIGNKIARKYTAPALAKKLRHAHINVNARTIAPYVFGAAATLILTVIPAHAAIVSSSAPTYKYQPPTQEAKTQAGQAYYPTPVGVAFSADLDYIEIKDFAQPLEGFYFDPYLTDSTSKNTVEDYETTAEPLALQIDYSEFSPVDSLPPLEPAPLISAADFQLSGITLLANEEIIVHESVRATKGQIISFSGDTPDFAAPASSLEDGRDPTASTGTFVWPVEGRLSSLFGPRRTTVGSSNHRGIDISGPHGTPVFAADGGEVIFSGRSGAYGNKIKIEHDNGIVTLYAHNSENLVRAGQRVAQGELIAKTGTTGRVSGPHLHFEVIINGSPVNPLDYLPRIAG